MSYLNLDITENLIIVSDGESLPIFDKIFTERVIEVPVTFCSLWSSNISVIIPRKNS